MNCRTALRPFLGPLAAALATFAQSGPLHAAGPGDQVVVIYNDRAGPESKRVAQHYAERRGVPKDQVLALDLPRKEDMTRDEFREHLQQPLLKALEKRKLLRFEERPAPGTPGAAPGVRRVVAEAKIRYLVLAYGVPLRVTADPNLKEPLPADFPARARRNEAAVDSELAALPLFERGSLMTGPLTNPFFGATNAAQLNPRSGAFMVARLDGPTVEIANALVDKALQAETNGLWGRAFFDARGLTNGPYLHGDEWIRAAYVAVRRQGFESLLDDQPPTFPKSFPMPQIALYGGWYDGAVSGPFLREPVEFMPGAVAYHLHSFSARTIRSPSAYWVGPFLARGVTATFGNVEEPYLECTPHVDVFFAHLISLGRTFGEAVYAAMPVLSWQTTVVGDPLYRPMARAPQELHEALERRGDPNLAWSQLRIVNLNLAVGEPPQAMAAYLQDLPLTRTSAVLTEKLADLYSALGQTNLAGDTYLAALKLDPSPNQRIQIELSAAETLAAAGRCAESLAVCETFFDAHPNYPDLLRFYQAALAVAQKAEDARLIAKYEAAIQRLTPRPPAADTNSPPAKP